MARIEGAVHLPAVIGIRAASDVASAALADE